MSDDRCNYYDGHRYCRNKPYSVRNLYDGREAPGWCRKHTAQELRKWEQDNRQLAFYLRYKHLLEKQA